MLFTLFFMKISFCCALCRLIFQAIPDFKFCNFGCVINTWNFDAEENKKLSIFFMMKFEYWSVWSRQCF